MHDGQLRAARGFLNVSQQGMADVLGVSVQTIRNMEQGVHRPRAKLRDKIVERLGHRGIIVMEMPGGMTGLMFDKFRSNMYIKSKEKPTK